MLISVLGILAASCNQIIDDPTSGDCEMDTEKVQITFTLSMKAAAPDSRPWGTDYDPDNIGNEFENQIDLDKLQVLVYNDESSFVGEVDILAYWKVEENVYEFRGELANVDVSKNTNYKIMVFANCPDVNDSTTLANLSYNFYGTGTDKNTDYIPMWGVKTTQFTLERFQDLGTIKVLRAMSKVEVKLNEDFTDYTLKSVQLNAGKYNKDGFCLPTGYANAAKTEDMGIISVFNPKNTGTNAGNATSALPFTKTGNTHYVYIPEYTTTIDVENPSMTITLVDNANNEKTYPLEFKYYSVDKEGPAFNVVRNHYYEYTITGVNDGYNLLLTCEVQPWDVEEIAIDYTDIATYTPLGWQEDTYDEQYSNEQNIYLTKGTTAIYKFQLESPQTAQIYASLTNSEDFYIGTQIVESEIKDTTTGTTSIIKEVTISISAKDETDGIIGRYNETSLRVFAIMDNQESVELDMTGNSNTSTQQGDQVARYKIIQNY